MRRLLAIRMHSRKLPATALLYALGLTQEEFATTYRIPVGTLRDWEQRRKNPDATARAYLIVIDKDPKAVAALLNAA